MSRPPAHLRRRQQGRWRSAAFASFLAVLVIAGVGLAYAGVRTVRESTAGQRFDPSTDPDEPGFEAFVEPTPTLLLLHEGPSGLVSAALLALSGQDEGGVVLLVPGGTVLDPLGDAQRLDDVFARRGTQPTVRAVEQLLGIGIQDARVVDDPRWATLVEPVAPLTVDNPDDLDGFPAGPVELTPTDVSRWLEVAGPGSAEANRLLRQQLFWQEWIGAVGRSDADDPVPGEVDAGIGRFIRTLAAGPSTVDLLPGREEPGDLRGANILPEPGAIGMVVAAAVPLPTAAEPGGRTRVRVLDGIDDPDIVFQAVPRIVPVGAEIVIAGNSSEGFDHGETEVRFHDPASEDAARRIRDSLDVGRVVDDLRPTDSYDVTVVLGADALAALR
jgi:hypothetical protein